MLMPLAKTALTPMPRERVITGESHGEEENRFNYSLRPQRFVNYIGQPTLIRRRTGPMRSRFGIVNHIEFYSPEALHEIIRQNTKLMKLEADDKALWELARRSRGTPRIANRLLRRARDFAAVEANGKLTVD